MKTYYAIFAVMIGAGILGQFDKPWLAVLVMGSVGLIFTVMTHVERISDT